MCKTPLCHQIVGGMIFNDGCSVAGHDRIRAARDSALVPAPDHETASPGLARRSSHAPSRQSIAVPLPAVG